MPAEGPRPLLPNGGEIWLPFPGLASLVMTVSLSPPRADGLPPTPQTTASDRCHSQCSGARHCEQEGRLT